MIHELKTEIVYFQKAWEDMKKFTIRINDRNFQVGDLIIKKEINIGQREIETQYTGREIKARIIYTSTYRQYDDVIVLGFEVIEKGICLTRSEDLPF